MILQTIRLVNLIMVGLIAGILFGISIGYNPEHLSAPAYVEQQQSAINALNTLMPILGLITIVLTLAFAFLQKDNQVVRATLLVAAVLLITSGLVTRFGNQPINSVVITWDTGDIPASWAGLRDKWWSFHLIRTATTLAAFCLIGWVNVYKLSPVTRPA